jgi:hypothetical protein
MNSNRNKRTKWYLLALVAAVAVVAVVAYVRQSNIHDMLAR